MSFISVSFRLGGDSSIAYNNCIEYSDDLNAQDATALANVLYPTNVGEDFRVKV